MATKVKATAGLLVLLFLGGVLWRILPEGETPDTGSKPTAKPSPCRGNGHIVDVQVRLDKAQAVTIGWYLTHGNQGERYYEKKDTWNRGTRVPCGASVQVRAKVVAKWSSAECIIRVDDIRVRSDWGNRCSADYEVR